MLHNIDYRSNTKHHFILKILNQHVKVAPVYQWNEVRAKPAAV